MENHVFKVVTEEINDKIIFSLLRYGTIQEQNGVLFLTADLNKLDKIKKIKGVVSVNKTKRKVQ